MFSLSMGFSKPNNLGYHNLMDVQGESLLQDEAREEVIALIALQRHAEKVSVFYRGKVIDPHDPNHSVIADMNVQTFQNELEQWRLITRNEIRNLRA